MAGVMHFTASILLKKQAFRLPSLAWSNRDILYIKKKIPVFRLPVHYMTEELLTHGP